jgi:hypothetical protein
LREGVCRSQQKDQTGEAKCGCCDFHLVIPRKWVALTILSQHVISQSNPNQGEVRKCEGAG